MGDDGGIMSDVLLTAVVVVIVLFLAFVVGPRASEVISSATPTP